MAKPFPFTEVSGPLAPHAAGFKQWLVARGFTPGSAYLRVLQFAHLSRWLEQQGLCPDELTAQRGEQFVAALRAAGYTHWTAPQSLRLPLAYLHEAGVVPVPAPMATEGDLERLLGDYRRYLVCERGLAERTIGVYERVARLFLAGRDQPGGLALDRLCAADISRFLAGEAPRRSVPAAQQIVTGLRALLRYLHTAGVIAVPLRWAVPGVADRRDRALPRGLAPATVAKLLASCDRRRTVGRRDYAAMLLLVRLGLRVGEVAAMRLEDIDWRRGALLVRGKGDRHESLPLPHDLGEALVSYLRRRPESECRALFLRIPAPRGPIGERGVSDIVRRACARAGLLPISAHRLRHTVATGMLRAGGSLTEIQQVLRHSRLQTTGVYAKVDRAALRSLARPWPGSAA